MTDPKENKAFLSRWSRLKQSGGEAEPPPAATPPAPALDDPIPEPNAEPTDADMPPVEALTAESDFSPFLSPKVSEGLRRLALRKLFHLPEFNVTDGLNDYDEDYTMFRALGDVVTHEMRRMQALEEERAKKTQVLEDADEPRVESAAAGTQAAPASRAKAPPAADLESDEGGDLES